MPAAYIIDAERWLAPVARQLAHGFPSGTLVGISGAQGTGKSTAARLLVRWLATHGRKAVSMSLDDFYLTLQERQELSRRVHPLLASRGVPGTHDTQLLLATLNALRGDAEVRLPRFDKAADDRVATRCWPRLRGPMDIILLEGWFVGARPQTAEALRPPVNRLEREEDADGRWRRHVNDQLGEDYQRIFERMAKLVVLQAPSFRAVFQWRALQERKLRARAGEGRGLMDNVALKRFIEHFERLTRHCIDSLPERADLLLQLDQDHRIVARHGPGLDQF